MLPPIHARLESLTVADVMANNVATVSRNDTLGEAAEAFLKQDVSAAPVVDERGFCVGIISATDFLRQNYSESSDESLLIPLDSEQNCAPLGKLARSDRGDNNFVCRFMTPCLQTVSATDRLLHAAQVMDAQHIHRLPVLDDFGHPIGIISTMDIVSALLNAIEEAKIKALR